MTKQYSFYGYFGTKDKVVDPKYSAGKANFAPIDFLTGDRSWRFGIHEVVKQLRHLKLKPSEKGFDLLVLALMVQMADAKLNREQTSQDNWCREIEIILPVSDVHAWNNAKKNLEVMLRFLTGDRWRVEFRNRNALYKNIFNNKYSTVPAYDGIHLFSGGMDSLINAIDKINEGKKPLFVSHGGDATVSKSQQEVFQKINDQFGKKVKFDRVRIPSGHFDDNLFPNVKSEYTTRGRSFLFFALASFVGTAFKKDFELIVPENGLIALNVPLDGTRLGASSTRTAHPYYIHRWQQLLDEIQLPAKLKNPYWNKTKGEMLKECKDQKFLKNVISTSISCASPASKRYSASNDAHCGQCVPCIIRRAAIGHAMGLQTDPTGYRLKNLKAKPLNAKTAEGRQIRAFQHAISRINKSTKCAGMLIYKPGPLLEDADKIGELTSMYLRGMKEVEFLLNGVKTIA